MRGSGRDTDHEPCRPQSATDNDAPVSGWKRLRCRPPATVGSGKTLRRRTRFRLISQGAGGALSLLQQLASGCLRRLESPLAISSRTSRSRLVSASLAGCW